MARTRGISFAIVAALSLSSSPPAARPQEAVNPADTIYTIEVTAQREAMRKAIHAFVANVTRFDGENVARWHSPICPSVTGIAPEHVQFMRGRIVEIAKSVGAPLARNQEKCDPNLVVILTPQPDQLWATLKDRNPKMFNTLQPQRVERALSTRPVQTVQNIVFNNSDGTSAFNKAGYRLRDSHIYNSVTEDFTSVVVVINDAETGKATFGQLADYVGMVALARVDLSADFAGADSILRLFATPESATPPPARLTEWDRSFLKTLYGVDISYQRPRSLISTTMFNGLVPELR
jgi:hypothetical protein